MKKTGFAGRLAMIVAPLLLGSPSLAQGPTQVTFVDLGGGCAVPASCNVPSLVGFGGVGFCSNLTVSIPPAVTTPVLVLGAAIASIDLSSIAPGCVLAPFPHVVVPLTPMCGGGCSGVPGCGFNPGSPCSNQIGILEFFAVPPDPALIGAIAYAQLAVVSSSPGLQLSNALALTFS